MTAERLREIARAIRAGESIVWDARELFEAANMIDYLSDKMGCEKCHDKWYLPPGIATGLPGVTWVERAGTIGARLHAIEDANTRPNVEHHRPAEAGPVDGPVGPQAKET